MKKHFYSFICIFLVSSISYACSSEDTVLVNDPSLINQNVNISSKAPAKNYTPVEKPQFVYSVGIYPQDMAKFKSKVTEFMSQHVTKDDVADYKFGGWVAIDDAQAEIKFYGVKDIELFLTKIVPDLKYVLGSYGGNGNIYDSEGKIAKPTPKTPTSTKPSEPPAKEPTTTTPWYKKIFS